MTRSAFLAIAITFSGLHAGCTSDPPEQKRESETPSPSTSSDAPPDAAHADPVSPVPDIRKLPASDAPPWFRHVADDGGIDFAHVSGEDGTYPIPASLSGGVALLDIDGDGDLDVYCVQGGDIDADDRNRDDASRRNRLYRNDGNLRFEDVTDAWDVGDSRYGLSATAGDYDGDGDDDLYVCNLRRDTLYRNDGDKFVDVTEGAGLAGVAVSMSSSAAFVDHDGDGDLDLYVCRYMNWSREIERNCLNARGEPDYCLPTVYDAAASDLLFENDGRGGFADISTASGIASVAGTGLAVVAADFDDDNDVDFFVANDAMPDRLWLNQGNDVFVEDGLLAGVAVNREAKATSSMGVGLQDADNDGDLDIVIGNLAQESDTFFRNTGSGMFSDDTARVGLAGDSRSVTRFGLGWYDFDHDGHLDLYLAAGRVIRAGVLWSDDHYAEPDLVLRGGPNRRYESVEPRGGVSTPLIRASRGAAFGDLDGDGDIDLVCITRDNNAYLLENVAGVAGQSLHLDAGDDAVVDAVVDGGSRDGTRLHLTSPRSHGYFASNDPAIHVGLGDATGLRDLVIRWPDGSTRAIDSVAAGDRIMIRRNSD